ncbi:hypothetical protein KIPB_013976, partial [Kipferlia bialata]
ALAAKVLVTRVASGRVFSKVLNPSVMHPIVSMLVDMISPREARDLVESVRQRQLGPLLESTVLMSILYRQLQDHAVSCPPTPPPPGDRATDFALALKGFIYGMRRKGWRMRGALERGDSFISSITVDRHTPRRGVQGVLEGGSVGSSGSEEEYPGGVVQYGPAFWNNLGNTLKVLGQEANGHDVRARSRRAERAGLDELSGADSIRAAAAELGMDQYASDIYGYHNPNHLNEEERQILKKNDIQFYPIVVYAKLDIQGFTK